MNKIATAFLVLILSSLNVAAMADQLYVTDRILLGVHQDETEVSPVIESIPSGTAVTVIQKGDQFTKIQLADGKQGWVSTSYLKPDKPATAQLDTINAQLKQAQDKITQLQDEIKKHDRASQVQQDAISNDKSTIKELKKKLKDQLASMPSPSKKAEQQLKSQQDQITKLQAQIKQLNDDKQALIKESKSPSVTSMHDLQTQNQQLQARIAAAVANLKGEQVPSASQLASIRPSFPLWYWILLLALFIGGLAVGYGWFDYHHRKRHGGFRI